MTKTIKYIALVAIIIYKSLISIVYQTLTFYQQFKTKHIFII